MSESKFPALAMGARGRLSAESKRLKATGKPKAPGSRTVSCPVCSRSLFMHQLNCHLDACLLSKPVAAPAHQPADISQAASGADGAAGQPSAQASHGPAACTASPGVAAELAAQDVESEQPEPTPQVASRSRTGWGSLSRAPQLSQDHLALARLSSGQKVDTAADHSYPEPQTTPTLAAIDAVQLDIDCLSPQHRAAAACAGQAAALQPRAHSSSLACGDTLLRCRST